MFLYYQLILNKLSICQKIFKHLEISSVMGVCEYQQISECEMELSLLSLHNIVS